MLLERAMAAYGSIVVVWRSGLTLQVGLDAEILVPPQEALILNCTLAAEYFAAFALKDFARREA
jgi:hypothetical protein